VIRLAAGPGQVRAALEDDFHHFRIELRHDGRTVTGIATDAVRAPYTLCPAAGRQLGEIVGMALADDMTAVFRIADARQQCTHQFDLAALAVASAARGIEARRYDIFVEDERPGVDRHAILRRDGECVLDWTLADYGVAAPEPYAGRSLGSGFTAWVAEALTVEEAEAALVLRRGVFIAGGREIAKQLEDILPIAPVTGGCWVQQEARAADAARIFGSTLDFGDRPDLLTGDDADWLARG
jgi:hypothetical protein